MRFSAVAVPVSLVLLLLLSPLSTLGTNSDGPTFPLEVSTDRYYYGLGEDIVITITNIGDELITFGYWPDIL
ncbi:MAG: hypothetical protein ACE5IO_06885, partial [Thermoplasmata archaeon]